ncbi:hypothetical protein HMPREF3230_01337 [Gardnerella vaginalis]|uniref:Uncharacterized protein n=2 Tax=Bifidobacteriaceae TaxID=31953 RepID=A0A135Z1U5_GARVA|nr:hypothetical protein HMPREF3230_01337 [Gardnerella vaginalis]
MMFKRLFWISIGFIAGVLTVSKFRAYLKTRLSSTGSKILDDENPDNITLQTLLILFKDFNSSRKKREEELNSKYAEEFNVSKYEYHDLES